MADTTLVLSDLTTDVDQFVAQFQQYLVNKPTWVGNLTTQTSQTLVELVSSVGTFAAGRIGRAYEDSFSETAQADSAVLAITQMQGIRLTRYLPAGVQATLTSPVTVTLSPLTQLSSGGNYYFNRKAIQLVAGVAQAVTLYEGKIYAYAMNGLGTEHQTFVSSQDGFVISDQDVIVQVNGTIIPKSYGGLWNFDGLPGYSDMSLSDGRLLIQFGNLGGINGQFGTMPSVNDVVVISYPVSQGAGGNNVAVLGKAVSITGFPLITGVFTTNPTGGANDKPVIAYKNVAAGGFGTYTSAVTKNQYSATINTYPGILDAITQAQREIDPSQLKWMNVIRVAGLTQSPWTAQQKRDFLDYCQSVTMYAPYFIWQDPIPVPRDINLDVYIFNSAIPSQVQAASYTAIQNLFAPRPGIMMTNFYIQDLLDAVKAQSPGQVSYVIPNSPTGSMIVTAPESPEPDFTLVAGGGSLGSLVYAYGISTVLATGEEGTPSNWVFPQIVSATANYAIKLTWPAVYGAASYKIWGRAAGSIGLIAQVAASQLQYVDTGSVTPSGGPPNSIADVPIRYNSINSLTINVHYAERQQRFDNTNPTRLQ